MSSYAIACEYADKWKAEAMAAREYIEWLESFVPLTTTIVSSKEQAYLDARVVDNPPPDPVN